MNNLKKISIISLFLLVSLPALSFAASSGSGYNPSNGSATQDPDTKNKSAFPTGSGYNPSNGTALQPPKGPGTSPEQPLVTCGGVTANGQVQPECTVNDLNVLLQSILNLVFIFAGFIVAGMFMYAGFLLITAGGNTAQIQKARGIFKRVVIGFLIMFASYLLVKNLLDKIGADEFFKNLIK